MEYHISVYLRINQNVKKRIHPMRPFIIQQRPKRNDIIQWIGCDALDCSDTRCIVTKQEITGTRCSICVLVKTPPTWVPLFSYFNEIIGYMPHITETNAQSVMEQMGYMFDGMSFDYQFEYILPVQSWKVCRVDFQNNVITLVSS